MSRRAASTFILLTVALDMLAMGMIAPVLPRLVASFMSDNASAAAQMLGWFGTVFAVAQFFCSPILGSMASAARMPAAASSPRPSAS